MTDFTLDTSGEVRRVDSPSLVLGTSWPDLSPFEQGYVEAMFADGILDIRGANETRHYIGFGFSDLAPETLAAIRKDCAAFVTRGRGAHNFTPDAEAGARFWEARQTLFPKSGSAVLVAAFPPLTFTLGDDGRVYLRGAAQ